MRRLLATVHGNVQGVSFRAYTQREALRLHITGWVANQWDGTVKVTAEGSDEALLRLVQWLHRGPPAARVDQVEVAWSDGSGEFKGFQIRY
jgi:acylphosphatase